MNHLVVLSNAEAPNWFSRYNQGLSGDRHDGICLLMIAFYGSTLIADQNLNIIVFEAQNEVIVQWIP